jgi:hypothetical protein
VDHSRTTQPHAGESMIDTLWFPGLLLIAVGIIGLVGIVASAAYGNTEWVLPLALVTGAVVTAGGGLIFLEHRRVNRIEQLWRAEHPRPGPHGHVV